MICKSSALGGLLLLVCAFVGACGAAQPFSEKEKTKESTDGIQLIAIDQLGQRYVVDQHNEVIQYRADGSRGFHYNNNTLGRLALIDPTNPFAMLLYYPDFQTIVLLDRTLNEQARIVLSALDLIDIELIAMGNDNYIWLYDGVDVQLKKLDREGQILLQSDPLNQLLQRMPAPTQLLASNNRLVLNDPEEGILIFDLFGRYETTLPVRSAEHLQWLDEYRLAYLREGVVYAYDLRALQERPLPLRISCRRDCQLRIGKEKAYWLEAGQLRQQSLANTP